jgi:hypothetical protein
LEVRLAEVRLAEVRLAQVRPAEVRLVEVRPTKVLLDEVRLAEVWENGTFFVPPSVSNLAALPEEVEVLLVRHCAVLHQPKLVSQGHHGRRSAAMASSRRARLSNAAIAWAVLARSWFRKG